MFLIYNNLLGNYAHGERNGKGKYVWANGNKYEGDWTDNMINGYGKYTWSDGRVYEG